MYCRGNPLKYSDPSGYQDTYIPPTPSGLIKKLFKDPISEIQKTIKRAGSNYNLIPQGYNITNLEVPEFVKKADEAHKTGAFLSWAKQLDKKIENGEREPLSENELDTVILEGYRCGAKDNMRVDAGHTTHHKNPHLNYFKTDDPEKSFTHFELPPGYEVPKNPYTAPTP